MNVIKWTALYLLSFCFNNSEKMCGLSVNYSCLLSFITVLGLFCIDNLGLLVTVELLLE